VGISSRDWHDVNEKKKRDIPRIFVYADSLSEDGILEGLRNGQVFVSSEPRVYFSAKYGDRKYEYGDETKIMGEKSINFQIQIENLKESSQLQMIKNGLKFFNASLAKRENQRISFSDLSEENSWYRCEIYTAGGNLLCFTNSVFLIS